MAKTAKIKKRQSTLHSRAARRALSPPLSIAVSKTLPDHSTEPRAPPSVTPHSSKTILSAHSSGIRKPKAKPLKHSQRLRHQAGIQRAFNVLDKREVKVQKSVGKERKVKERKKGWEELNPNLSGKKGKTAARKGNGNAFEALEDVGVENRGEREWVSDEEMPEMDVDVDVPEVDVDVDVPEETDEMLDVGVQGKVKEVVVPESVPLPAASTLEEDELL